MREEKSVDLQFPVVHLRPARNWVNDPNGLVYHDGQYHVFFQYNPESARHGNVHWGHFVSEDLCRWDLLPEALAPSVSGPDRDGVWSGNAISHGGGLVAFFSAKDDGRFDQPVAIARSRDGVTFVKDEQLAVPAAPAGTSMFRDPFVWWDGTRWRMLVGASLDDGQGAALQFVATDRNRLVDWRYEGVFFSHAPQALPGGQDTGSGWECVQIIPLTDELDAVLTSAWEPVDGAKCAVGWVGTTRDGAFYAGSVQRLDYGPDFYAPAIMRTPAGRTLLWGWIWEARDERIVGAPSSWIDEVGWAGMLSLPRELFAREDGRIGQRPAVELEDLRGRPLLNHVGSSPVPLGMLERACELRLRLEGDAGLRVTTSLDGREYLEIRRVAESGDVVVDRDHSSLDDRAKRGSWNLPCDGDHADLRVVIDHSVVEVFTAAGDALTCRFYPVSPDPWRAFTTGMGRHLVAAWALHPLQIIVPRW